MTSITGQLMIITTIISILIIVSCFLLVTSSGKALFDLVVSVFQMLILPWGWGYLKAKSSNAAVDLSHLS